MSMDLGGAKGGVKSDINVTPLVDVMLVLLIIMMVVAPLLNQGVPMVMPGADNATAKPDTSDQTIVSVDSAGAFYVNAIAVTSDGLVQKLNSVFEDKGQKVVYLKGDQDAPYGAIMTAMDALRKAQIDTVALITAQKKKEGS